MNEVIADILVAVGTLVVVLASVAAARARSVFRRLHYLTVITSVGAPAIGAGAVVVDGLGLTGATVLAIVVLLAITGPILGAAVGRLNAQREGVIPVQTPR